MHMGNIGEGIQTTHSLEGEVSVLSVRSATGMVCTACIYLACRHPVHPHINPFYLPVHMHSILREGDTFVRPGGY